MVYAPPRARRAHTIHKPTMNHTEIVARIAAATFKPKPKGPARDSKGRFVKASK
jgi:hypothetical protein